MPWCVNCDKFLNPASVGESGSCPDCGSNIEVGELAKNEVDETVKVPWHFWVGVGAVVLYLGWRLIQGIGLLF